MPTTASPDYHRQPAEGKMFAGGKKIFTEKNSVIFDPIKGEIKQTEVGNASPLKNANKIN